MGPGNTGNKIYFNVSEGKFVQRVKEDTEGAIKRVTKENKTVYELKYNTFEGILKDINVVEKHTDWGDIKTWNFDFWTPNHDYQIQVQYSSGYSVSMLKSLCSPDVDFDQPIELAAWSKVIDGKSKNKIYVKQGGKDILPHFTKDNPNGLPQLELIKIPGKKDQWNDYKMMTFFEDWVNNKIKPKLGKSTGMHVVSDDNNGLDFDPNNAPESDDLPF